LTEDISQTHRNFGAAGNPLALLTLTRIENTLENLDNEADAVRPALFEARSRHKDEEKIKKQREERQRRRSRQHSA
jgi:hypothetical protein